MDLLWRLEIGSWHNRYSLNGNCGYHHALCDGKLASCFVFCRRSKFQVHPMYSGHEMNSVGQGRVLRVTREGNNLNISLWKKASDDSVFLFLDISSYNVLSILLSCRWCCLIKNKLHTDTGGLFTPSGPNGKGSRHRCYPCGLFVP
jgi:hypothetical protein